MTMARKRKILVPHGAIKIIAADTGTSAVSVRAALKGITDSRNADLVRERALRFYGGVLSNVEG